MFFFLAPQSLYVDNIYRIDLELDEFAVCRCLQDPPFPGFYDQARSYGSGGKVMGPATCTVYHSLKLFPQMSINEQRLKPRPYIYNIIHAYKLVDYG